MDEQAIPPFFGAGENDDWLWGEDGQAVAKADAVERQKEEHRQICADMKALFGSRRGQRIMTYLEATYSKQAWYGPGITTDQAMVMSIGTEAQRALLARIRNMMNQAEQ